jgi:hypothetical protein
MNDESKKLMDNNAGHPFHISETWLAAFEEMLKIVNLHPQDDARDRIRNVRRAILDELGETGDKSKEPSKVVSIPSGTCESTPSTPQTEDFCDCRHDDVCDMLKDRCKSIANLERIERLKTRDEILTAADYAALPRVINDERVGLEKCKHDAAKSVVTTYGDGSRTIKCKKCGYVTDYGRE